MQTGVIVAYIRNRKWLENFKNQIMLEKHNLFRGVRVKEPLMNLKKYRSCGGSRSSSDSTSGCGGSGKILSWSGKCKLELL